MILSDTVDMKSRQLRAVRLLEGRLKGATPADAGKLTKQLVRLKDDWLNK